MIPGTVIGLQGGVTKFGSYRATYGNNTATDSFSFANCDIGPPASGRVIAIVVNYFKYDTSSFVISITVGGTSLTRRITSGAYASGGTGSYVYTDIWSGVVPTGSTATVALEFEKRGPALSYGCQIGIWAMYDLSSPTPVITTSTTGGTGSLSANVQQNDFGIVGSSGVYGTSGSFVYANATERYDTTLSGVSQLGRSGADFTALVNQTPRTVTVTPSGISDSAAYAMAVWR
jgi:hypothetical protein